MRSGRRASPLRHGGGPRGAGRSSGAPRPGPCAGQARARRGDRLYRGEGLCPALLGAAGQIGGGGRVAEPLAGVGPVGFEEVLFEALELAGHDGAADGVEEGVEHDHVVDRARAVEAAGGVLGQGVSLAAVGVVELEPVGDDPFEVPERHGAPVLDETVPAAGERLSVSRVAGGEQGDVVRGELPGQERRLGAGQITEPPGAAHHRTGTAAGQPALPRQPGRSRLGSRGLPGLRRVQPARRRRLHRRGQPRHLRGDLRDLQHLRLRGARSGLGWRTQPARHRPGRAAPSGAGRRARGPLPPTAPPLLRYVPYRTFSPRGVTATWGSAYTKAECRTGCSGRSLSLTDASMSGNLRSS